jgi:hypothetical protein
MRLTEHSALWAVYLMKVHGKADSVNAVCEQDVWDAMELARPGYHTLVKGRITSEAEAEKLARSFRPTVPGPMFPS